MFHKESKLEVKTETLFEKVCRLAIAQDENILTSMVNAGVYLHVYQNEYYPVTWLAEKGEHRAVELLIKKFKASCHHAAEGYARGGYVDYVNNLIAEGADRDTVVWGYARKGYTDQVKYQLENGAHHDYAVEGYAAAGLVDLVNLLLIQGADHNSAVYGYALRGDIDQVNHLIDKGACRESAISGYARGGHFDQMDSMIEPGTLDAAVRNCATAGYIDQVKRLREQGATRDPAAQGFARGGHIEQVQYLLEQGASRDSVAIGYAGAGHVDQVKYQIEQGASRDVVMWPYARNYYIDQVDQLLAQGGSIERALIGYSQGLHHYENVLRLMTLTSNKKLRKQIAIKAKGNIKSLDKTALLIKTEKLNSLMKKMQLNYEQAKSLTFIGALWILQGPQLVTSGKLPAEMFSKITSYLLGLSDRNTQTVQNAVYYKYRGELPPEIWYEIIAKLDPATILTKIAPVSRSFYEMATSDIVREKKLQQQFDGQYYVLKNSELSVFSLFSSMHRDKAEKYSPMVMKWLYFLREDEMSLLKMNTLNIKEMMPLLTEDSIDSLIFYGLWIQKNQKIRNYLFKLIFFFFSERKLGYDDLYNGYTLLHYLARLGPSKELIKTLIPEFNASNPVFDADGYSPLLSAIGCNLIEACELLIDHRAPIHIGNIINRYPPLYYAALLGHAEIVEYLCLHGIRHVDEPKHQALTPLCGAVLNGQILAAIKLLDFGADPNFSKENKCTLLHTAAVKGHVEIIKLLCERGAIKNINQATLDGETPIYLACKNGHSKAVAALVELGADPNKIIGKRSPLCIASENNHHEVVQQLVILGVDLDAADSEGKTALMLASLNGYDKVAEILIKYRAKVNLQCNCGRTALYYASRNGHVSIVNQLLNAYASPLLLAVDKISPLSVASFYGLFSVVKALLPAANINQQDNNGDTPISDSVGSGNADMVKLLLKHGADPRIKNHNGTTPLIKAIWHKNFVIVNLLVEAFPDLIYVTDEDGKRPIEYLQENPWVDRSFYSYLKEKEEKEELSTSLASKIMS